MGTDVAAQRSQAMELVARGKVSAGVAVLRKVVDATGDPDDRMLLGKMAYLATDVSTAQEHLEGAYREFQARGEPRRAALAATALGRVHFDMLDDKVVGRAWLARALRLLEHEHCVEKGYVIVGLFAVTADSADDLEASAREALDLAHQFRDPNLECKALGDWGLALISMGRVREGMARLDESVTLIIGGDCTDPAVVGTVFCGLISACDRCGDAARAEAWLRVIEERAPQTEGPGIHLYAHCWTALGSVLCHVGRWQEAETALRMGLAKAEDSYHYVKVTARAALADLWIRQGRLDEAARLIDQSIDRIEVMGPRARLYLAQQQYDLAAAVARQALRLSADQLHTSGLLYVLVEAELEGGNLIAAEAAAAQLQRMAERTEVSAVAVQASLAQGKIAMARGDAAEAARNLEKGLVSVGDTCPPLRAALHLELARFCFERAAAEAIVNAETALDIYQRLGSPEATAAADLLRALGRSVPDAPPTASALDVLSPRERDVLDLLAEGLSNPDIAKRLFITPKTAEHHVSSILFKLGLRSRTEAAVFAASHRISGDPGAPMSR